MLRPIQKLLLTLAAGGLVCSASAFSLLGPLDATFQVVRIGYNPLGFDIGGPMNLAEEYRWNLKIINYGFDPSFLNYFGSQGSNALAQAVAVLNNLPAFSKMSSNLTEFPTDVQRFNFEAQALRLIDLKTWALSALMEETGLAASERYVWCLRDRRDIGATTFYTVIKRNFDPVTLAPSSYVNGTLYTYGIVEFPSPPSPQPWADAVELRADPLAPAFTTVVSLLDDIFRPTSSGEFFPQPSRDEIGGLRYIYRKNNYNVEDLVPNSTGGSIGGGGSSPWTIVGTGGTNATNLVVSLALRPGIDKFQFKQVRYDSVLGFFTTVTNTYQDSYVTNFHLVTQSISRTLTTPDLIFAAGDPGLDAGGVPVLMFRTTAGPPSWTNNAALNTLAPAPFGPTAGPGVIQPTVIISFSKLGPWIQNATPNFLDELDFNTRGFVWASYDGTTNEPVLYPIGTSIQDLEAAVLGGP
jgi:hypothetical protein